MVQGNRKVIGSYENRDAALAKVRDLKDQGYKKEDITLYTNQTNASGLRDSQDVDVSTGNTTAGETRASGQEDDRSLWTQIKDVFSTDTYDYDTTSQDPNYNQADDVLYPYRDDITNGSIVVVVENYSGDTGAATVPPTGVDADDNPDIDLDAAERARSANRDQLDDNNDLSEDEKIRLKEERLDVNKKEEKTGEVNVRKETKHDTETVEVPVEREEVVVERKPVAGEEAETTNTNFKEDEESYTIPVKEEKVEVDKKPVVKEEVEIKKETHEDVEEVTEDVRREELDVDADDDTRTGNPKKDRKDRKNKGR